MNGASPNLWLLFGLHFRNGIREQALHGGLRFRRREGLLLAGEYRSFRSRWIWIGGLIALAISAPNLLWETRHGWPQIEVVRNAQLLKNEPVGPMRFLGEQVLFYSPIALPLWLGGLAWLFTARRREHFSASSDGLI